MLDTRGRGALLLLTVAIGVCVASGSASAACLARPFITVDQVGVGQKTFVALPPFLRATLVCGEGYRGPRGWKGNRGNTGPRGVVGARGATGAVGAAGSPGRDGTNGANGATGPQGPIGNTGPQGPIGNTGSAGTTGPAGGDGAPGVSGSAYVYSTAVQTVGRELDVTFDSNGDLTSEFSHLANSTDVVVSTAGEYKVTFIVSPAFNQPGQFAVFLNGVLVPGSIYGSQLGQINGQVKLAVAAGDRLTLRNHTSSGTMILVPSNGGTAPSIGASLLIEHLS